MLPIALGRATRIVQTLLKAGKEYVGIMHLHKEVSEEKLRNTIKSFVGKIRQIPPLKSAVKRQQRTREVYYFEILEFDKKDVLFKVGCEAGTYIRKLCLHPQTEILTKNGLLVASDFYFNHPKIYSFNDGKMIEKSPSATQKIPSPSKLIKITMSSGIDFTITPDHKFLVSKKEGYRMVEAQALIEGNYLAKSLVFPNSNIDLIIADLLDDDYYIQQEEIKEKCKRAFISKYGSIRGMYSKLKLDRKAFLSKSNHAITIRHLKLAGIYQQIKKKINTFKTQKGKIIKMDKLNEDFFYLLGLIASDGNNTREKNTVRHTRIKFHNKNKRLIKQFLKTYKKLFSNIPISQKKFQKNLTELDTANSFLATIAASLGIKSPQKYSSLLHITNTHPNLIKAFLRGYFDGDGSVVYHEKKTKQPTTPITKICLHTSSYQDAKSLHKMLLKVKIPNSVHHRKNIMGKRVYDMYEVSVENISAEKRFIKEIGTNHPQKLEKFKKILNLKHDYGTDDHYYIGFHYKEEIRKSKSKLYRMGGNLNRVLTSDIPITRRFYKRASKIVKLPQLDNFIIEKIKSIKKVSGTDYVYDMTVPGTHNFLIETGFVSSNCHDLGQKVGVGIHMAELRRTKAGPFDELTLFTLQDLTDAFWYYNNENNEKFLRKIIQPVENAVSHLPKIWVLDSTVESLCHGSDLKVPGISKFNEGIQKNDAAAIMTLKDELVALGIAVMDSEEILKAKKGISVRTNKVFMQPGVYKN